MAKLYKIDGTIEDVKSKKKKFSYEELKKIVGGMVEIVPLPSGKFIVVNEEGKLIGLPINRLASEAWLEEYPLEEYPLNNDGIIAGDALIAEEEEIE